MAFSEDESGEVPGPANMNASKQATAHPNPKQCPIEISRATSVIDSRKLNQCNQEDPNAGPRNASDTLVTQNHTTKSSQLEKHSQGKEVDFYREMPRKEDPHRSPEGYINSCRMEDKHSLESKILWEETRSPSSRLTATDIEVMSKVTERSGSCEICPKPLHSAHSEASSAQEETRAHQTENATPLNVTSSSSHIITQAEKDVAHGLREISEMFEREYAPHRVSSLTF